MSCPLSFLLVIRSIFGHIELELLRESLVEDFEYILVGSQVVHEEGGKHLRFAASGGLELEFPFRGFFPYEDECLGFSTLRDFDALLFFSRHLYVQYHIRLSLLHLLHLLLAMNANVTSTMIPGSDSSPVAIAQPPDSMVVICAGMMLTGGGGFAPQKRDGVVDSSPSPLERILRIIFNRKSLLLHVYDP